MMRATLRKFKGVKDTIHLVLEKRKGRFDIVDTFNLTNQEEINRLEKVLKEYTDREADMEKMRLSEEEVFIYDGSHGSYLGYYFIWIDVESNAFIVELGEG